MAATAKGIEEAGYRAVTEYETQCGRTCLRKQGVHYDMLSTGNGQVRHIEVKASKHRYPEWHVLQPKVFQAMRKDDRFYMYVVCDALSQTPVVHELTRAELIERFAGIAYTYRLSLGRKFLKSREDRCQQSPPPLPPAPQTGQSVC